MIFYKLFISALFLVVGPFLLLLIFVTGIHRSLIHQRLGLYRSMAKKEEGSLRIWLHGASVGEVQAIKVMIRELRRLVPDSNFVVTTMTVSGKLVAQQQLDGDVRCLLTPLDVPLIVNRVISAINPDAYVCVETELWPVLLNAIAVKKIPSFLVNGRMSENSSRSYARFKPFFSRIINTFTHMVFISERDKNRFVALGGNEAIMSIDGNIKYDLPQSNQPLKYQQNYLPILSPGKTQEILICGSTHNDEERLLVGLWERLNQERKLLLILAPRHLERLPEIEDMLEKKSIGFHLFSKLKGGEKRVHPCVLLDSMGELSTLYSVGTYIFCGGSLVECGGHNVIEPAVWNKVVLYGPHMDDFNDGKELLESGGGGFEVKDIRDLEDKIRYFRSHQEQYERACRSSGQVAAAQRGSGHRQALLVADQLLNSVTA